MNAEKGSNKVIDKLCVEDFFNLCGMFTNTSSTFCFLKSFAKYFKEKWKKL